MEILRTWIISIVSVMMITALLDIVLPSGSIRKYVNFVLGLVVMIIVLRPIIGVFSSSYQFDQQVFNFSYEMDKDELKSQLEKAEDNNTEQILNVYSSRISQEISNLIKKEQNPQEVRVNVLLDKDLSSESLGEIIGIDIFIKEGKAEASKDTVEIVKPVSSVIINKKADTDKDKYQEEDEGSYDDIKNSISNFYNVDKENISIYIQKNH